MPIRSLPPEARPRERLAEMGPNALSSIELLAILIASGTKERSALELASDLLSHFGSLDALAEATQQELTAIKGIGPAKALQLMAVFALAKRLSASKGHKVALDTAESAYREVRSLLEGEKTEVLYVLLLDARRNLIHKEEIGRGTLNHVIVHPREVFHAAIRHRAHSLILAHNHPTGDPTPSHADREITRQVIAAGRLIGIEVLDHLIVGEGKYFSFRERGAL